MKALPLAGFVFWLISFPMNGFLMPDAWGNLLFYFTLSSALSYFLIPWFLQEKSFDVVSRSGSILVVLLTVVSPLFQISGRILLPVMGITSVLVMFRAVAILRSSRTPVVSAGLAIALGNVLVFALSFVNLPDMFKFFIIAASLLPATFMRAEYSQDSNLMELKKYLAFIGVFYLVGGILYAYVIPEYEEVAIFKGFELLSYVFSALAGIYLVRRWMDITLALGIILGTLSFSFLLVDGPFLTVLGMFSIQAAFALIDLYILFLLVACGGSARVTGIAFGTVCLAITAGEAVSRHLGTATMPVLAAGNFILVTSIIIFYFTVMRKRDFPSELSTITGGVFSGCQGKGISREQLEGILEDLYEPFQKKLSEKEKSVLLMIVREKTYREAATELGISESTVKTHMKRICGKMGVSGKDELMRKLSMSGSQGPGLIPGRQELLKN
ncbi:MAG: helix-turn-helix transcriptional regulator [Nitrospirae bacterium]|nr:helix-turn-helix transcriptional regulator [Nitrospirota bacterium]